MSNFNEACAQQEVTSFVQAATCQSECRGCCTAPTLHPLHEYLDDNEEALAQAKALGNGTWPVSFYYFISSILMIHTDIQGSPPPIHARNQKQKPLECYVSGIEWQILILAKIHLFAYMLVQGVYQTRVTFLQWAAAVHFATWQMGLLTTPYSHLPHDHFKIIYVIISTHNM